MNFKGWKHSEISGLTWTEATKRLRNAIDDELKKYEIKRSDVIQRSFGHNFCVTSLCWAYVGYLFVGVLVFFSSSAFHLTVADDENLIFCGFILLFFFSLAVLLSIYSNYLKESEIRRKTRSLLKEMDNIIVENYSTMITPNLYAPPSDNIALQWTYRNGIIVNLPWILLVEGDIILLRSGRESPSRCKRLKFAGKNDDSSPCEFETGQIYVPDEVYGSGTLTVQPFEPLLCVVTETAVLRYVRTCISAAGRPSSLLENEYRRIIHFYMERFVVPAWLTLSVFVGAICYVFTDNSIGTWYETLILRPFLVVLPILSPIVPIFTFFFYLFNTSLLLTDFNDSKDGSVDNVSSDANKNVTIAAGSNLDLFVDETIGKKDDVRKTSSFLKTFKSVTSRMVDLALGECSSLPFSANIVFTLGNLTSLSVIDKKGILSWSNPSPEKVFFFSPARDFRSLRWYHREQSASTCSLYSSPNQADPTTTNNNSLSADASNKDRAVSTVDLNVGASSPTLRRNVAGSPTLRRKALKAPTPSPKVNSEVLDLTHDPNHEYLVHFDDSNWSNFSSNLKPLGLNILLNGCSLQSEYARFTDHVFAVSHVVPRTIAVVNRRCMCYFARAIGFRSEAASQFEHAATLASYKRTPGEIPLPGLTKHKTPLPNIFCTIVKDKLSDHKQIMCQGTADLVLDSCDFYWDGRSVKRLQATHRKKINDFAHRYSMTSYCIAFSYRPLNSEINGALSQFYIDWPVADYCKSPTGSVESLFEAECRPPLAVSYDSLLMDDYFMSPPVSNADDCLKQVLKGQVFLGVISLQYQAKLDVVRLVDNLDKACIRFVHYSKENELRSRVFAEKCGLEAGWNCHISLARDERRDAAATSHPPSINHASSMSNISSRTSLPFKGRFRSSTMNRELSANSTPTRSKMQQISSILTSSSSLPKDLKLDLPVVHFKSVAETPTDEPPKVVNVTPNVNDDSVFEADEGRPSSPTTERTPMLSDTTSHTSLITNQSSTAGLSASAAFFMTNRAQLPKGIENVRPHLRDVDNVPLLVPLFTDCYPEAIGEMIEIMQENGEIVGVLGSTLNYRNAEIFCQGNASIGIEPIQPSMCAHDDYDGYNEAQNNAADDSPVYNAVWLAHSISSLPCSLSVGVGERIRLLNLIAISRHLLMLARTSLVFYLNFSLFLTCIQFFNQLTVAPPLLSTGTLLYLLIGPLPLISGSLVASPRDDENVLKFATPKNVGSSSNIAVKMFLLGYVVKFLPTSIVLASIYKVTLFLLCSPNDSSQRRFCSSTTRYETTTNNFTSTTQELDDAKFVSSIEKGALRSVQSVFVVVLLFYICLISTGYVHYKQTFRQHCPFTNRFWTTIVIILLFMQISHSFFVVYVVGDKTTKLRFADIPWYIYFVTVSWTFVLILFNEAWKLYEIRIWLREQRRRRLLYQTKLGMNSPF